MTYSTAQKNLVAKDLIAELPGMHYRIARTWVTAESGANNNPLGVKIDGELAKYATMHEGVVAAAHLVRTSPLYAAVRRSIKGGTHDMQATAICRSPWHSGQAGLKAQGGLDHYYARVFRSRGYTVTPPPGGG